MKELSSKIIDNTLALIQIRHEKKNILNPDILKGIISLLNEYTAKKIRCAILTGSGDSFSAGYEINRLEGDFSVKSELSEKNKTFLQQSCEVVESLPYPVIAMIDGFCIGAGFELASCCDFRIASPESRFGITPAKIGLVYPSSGMKRVIRIVGETFARELFLTGKLFSAERMYQRGFLNYVVEKEKLYDFTLQLAGEIRVNSPVSVRGMKKAFAALANIYEFSEELTALTEESLVQNDLSEGVAAFYEKRKPVFTGE
jgi:enoyl-CoA hydratase